MNILLNRPDNLGDIVLTLPLAARLKQHFPACKIIMLARDYAKDLIESCQDLDQFISAEHFNSLTQTEKIAMLHALKIDVFMPIHTDAKLSALMRKARIPMRIGYTNRWHYLWNANKILHLKFAKCDLHQAQMSLQFLKAFNLPWWVPLAKLHELIHIQTEPSEKVQHLLDPHGFNLVLHPGSNGSGIEWPKAHYARLIEILPQNFKIYLTGSEKEADKFADLAINERVIPLFGTLNLKELIFFLSQVNGVVVGSTGPLHIAAALGSKVLGIFPAQQDLNVKAWGPLGKNASALEAPHCKISRPMNPKRCDCIKYITPEQVRDFIVQKWA